MFNLKRNQTLLLKVLAVNLITQTNNILSLNTYINSDYIVAIRK